MKNFKIYIKGPIDKVNNLTNFIDSFANIDKKTVQKKNDYYETFFIVDRKKFFKDYENILSFALKNNLDLRKLADNYALFGENIDHKIIKIEEKDPFGNDSVLKI